jgi:hypothetical protein
MPAELSELHARGCGFAGYANPFLNPIYRFFGEESRPYRKKNPWRNEA